MTAVELFFLLMLSAVGAAFLMIALDCGLRAWETWHRIGGR
jgi:hypothetical protein